MKTSDRGLIEIASHEGICLDPYLDSVGVWTIGIGQTKYDGFDPKATGHMDLKAVFDLFKRKIKDYEAPVNQLGLALKQHQYDALVSFCYNCGAGNLARLCKGRSLAEIGEALMFYTKPPEVAGRRKKEQILFQTGRYSNTDGKVLVFPVERNYPRYSKGHKIDVRPYLSGIPSPPDVEPVPAQPTTNGQVAGPVAGGAAAGTAAQQAGLPWWAIVLIGVAVAAAIAFVVWRKK